MFLELSLWTLRFTRISQYAEFLGCNTGEQQLRLVSTSSLGKQPPWKVTTSDWKGQVQPETPLFSSQQCQSAACPPKDASCALYYKSKEPIKKAGEQVCTKTAAGQKNPREWIWQSTQGRKRRQIWWLCIAAGMGKDTTTWRGHEEHEGMWS